MFDSIVNGLSVVASKVKLPTLVLLVNTPAVKSLTLNESTIVASAANACAAVKGNVVDTVATVTLEKAIALARTELTALLKVLFIFVSSFYFV